MKTLDDLVDWLESRIGTTIRGRTVTDCDCSISVGGSCKFTAYIEPAKTTPVERLIGNLSDHDEMVAHHEDIRDLDPEFLDPGLLRWEYWDEFADRQIREDESRGK